MKRREVRDNICVVGQLGGMGVWLRAKVDCAGGGRYGWCPLRARGRGSGGNKLRGKKRGKELTELRRDFEVRNANQSEGSRGIARDGHAPE